MKKIEVFEKVIAAEKAALEKGKETEYYKKYDCYPEEVYQKMKADRKKAGCPSTGILRAYRGCLKTESEPLVVDGFDCSSYEEMLETLETAKVKEFFELNTGTSLMDEIHVFAKAGWVVEAAEVVDTYWNEKRKALKFTKK